NKPLSKIALETVDVDPNRILNTLKLMIGEDRQRPTSETSLGVNIILFISLILLSLEDKTIPTLLKEEKYNELINEKDSETLRECYKITSNGNYSLKDTFEEELIEQLYSSMDRYKTVNEGFTI